MEGIGRKSLQGVGNIIRFNWHYYVLSSVLIAALCFSSFFLPHNISAFALAIAAAICVTIFTSLAVSWYIYDRSPLYSLNWLNTLNIGTGKQLVNINAGFDETSALLQNKFPGSTIRALDFYDPLKHTEVSIERARKAYPPFPGTQAVSTQNISLSPDSVDYIFLILAAHEIRNTNERIIFFKQLRATLRTGGRVVVTEHQRDLANFMAYNIGAFHFFPHKEWIHTFAEAGFMVETEFKITPFISTFILKPNGVTA